MSRKRCQRKRYSKIQRYKDKKIDGEIFKEEVSKTLEAPDITNLDFEDLKNAVVDSKGVMPTYFLTIDEIKVYIIMLIKTNKRKK